MIKGYKVRCDIVIRLLPLGVENPIDIPLLVLCMYCPKMEASLSESYLRHPSCLAALSFVKGILLIFTGRGRSSIGSWVEDPFNKSQQFFFRVC